MSEVPTYMEIELPDIVWNQITHSNMPTSWPSRCGRYYKQHTLEDLLNIKLDKSTLIVHPVVDNYTPPELDYNTLFKDAFAHYNRLSRLNFRSLTKPDYKRWIDKVRYNLHLFLIREGVVI